MNGAAVDFPGEEAVKRNTGRRRHPPYAHRVPRGFTKVQEVQKVQGYLICL